MPPDRYAVRRVFLKTHPSWLSGSRAGVWMNTASKTERIAWSVEIQII
jgi:hypothetical protein